MSDTERVIAVLQERVSSLIARIEKLEATLKWGGLLVVGAVMSQVLKLVGL